MGVGEARGVLIEGEVSGVGGGEGEGEGGGVEGGGVKQLLDVSLQYTSGRN